MHISAPGTADFVGPAPLHDMVQQIAMRVGSSGPNDEYLFELCGCMRALQVHDPDLFALESALVEYKRLSGEREPTVAVVIPVVN